MKVHLVLFLMFFLCLATPAKAGTFPSPDAAWRAIEDKLRATSEIAKTGGEIVPGYVTEEIGSALTYLREEIKPEEGSRLIQAFTDAQAALDDFNGAEDHVAALPQLQGTLALLKIEFPPGLFERLAGSAVRMDIINAPRLVKGQESKITLRLKHTKTGKPVKEEDMEIVHTERIHVFAIEPQLSDYHHIHSVSTGASGEYDIAFTPETDCGYRLWVDVTPKDGKREVGILDVGGTSSCTAGQIDRANSTSFTGGGFVFDIAAGDDIVAGRDTTVKLTVKDAAGVEVTRLEPIMGAFAHLAGFYDDYQTIAHTHPTGKEPETDTARGGPELSFHLTPERPGFLRLYAQVKIDRKILYAPFGVEVTEAGAAKAVEAEPSSGSGTEEEHSKHH